MSSTRTLKLTLGPMLFFWPKAQTEAFYRTAADWPVDSIYLGESVCSRRQQLRTRDWIALADELAAAGKDTVLSSLALIESESDLKRLRQLVDDGHCRIEANDLAAAKLVHERGLPFVAGPTLNIYNTASLALFRRLGAVRWVPPVEMGETTLHSILATRPDIETEVFAFGRLPLALSARCFTARHYNLTKDDCQFRCMEHPDGLRLATREGEGFLCINGIQTLSDGCQSLLPHAPALAGMGVTHLRISPQVAHTADIVAAHRAALDAGTFPDLQGWSSSPLVDGYWHGRAGITPTGA